MSEDELQRCGLKSFQVFTIHMRKSVVAERFRSHWSDDDVPDLTHRTYVITGANSGIGLESARYIARAGAHVILACRNEAKARAAIDDIIGSIASAQIEFMPLNLGDLSSVRACADALQRRGEPLHGLMNNAGVFALDHGLTTDGFETHFGVNHLGHFALTGLLLPLLLETPQSRIVNVSSLGHRPGRVDLADPMFTNRRYSRWGAYFQSKLANLLFSQELHRRLMRSNHSTMVVSAHPGTARTEIGRMGTSLTNSVIRRFMPILVRDGVQGARSQVRALVDQEVGSGDFLGPRFYFFGSPVREQPSRRARRLDHAEQLWELSENLTGIRFPL